MILTAGVSRAARSECRRRLPATCSKPAPMRETMTINGPRALLAPPVQLSNRRALLNGISRRRVSVVLGRGRVWFLTWPNSRSKQALTGEAVRKRPLKGPPPEKDGRPSVGAAHLARQTGRSGAMEARSRPVPWLTSGAGQANRPKSWPGAEKGITDLNGSLGVVQTDANPHPAHARCPSCLRNKPPAGRHTARGNGLSCLPTQGVNGLLRQNLRAGTYPAA